MRWRQENMLQKNLVSDLSHPNSKRESLHTQKCGGNK